MNRIQLNLSTSFQKRKKLNFNIINAHFSNIATSYQFFLLSNDFKDRCNAIRRIHSTMKSDYNAWKIQPEFL